MSKNKLILIKSLITFTLLFGTSFLFGAPCNGNGQGGGNKCTDFDEVSEALDQVGDSVTTTNQNVSKLNLSVNDLRANAATTNQRLDTLEETKHFLEVGVRVADTKHLDVELYNQYDWRHQRNYSFGMKFLFKPGQSYEERLIQEQAYQILQLRKALDKAILGIR